MLVGSFIKSAVALVSILSIPILTSCDDDDNGTGPPLDGEASVQFANAYPESNLVLRAHGVARGPAVAYQESGGCHILRSGSVDFALRNEGSSTDLITFPATTLASNRNYTVFATGAAALPIGLVLPDTFGSVAAGRAKLRIVNATHSSYSFDIHIGGTVGSPLTPGTVTEADLGFLDQAIVDLPAGATLVRLSATGFLNVVGSYTFTLASQSRSTLVITSEPTSGAGFEHFIVPACPQS